MRLPCSPNRMTCPIDKLLFIIKGLVKKAVLKAFCLQIFRLVVLTLILIQVAFGLNSAIAQESPSTKTPPPETVEEALPSDKPAAEEQPALNQDSEKEPTVSQSQRSYPQPPQEYDMEALEKFDAELYGD